MNSGNIYSINFQISSGNIDYIPFNQALVLEGKEDEGEQLKKELQELRDAMKERFMNLSLRFDALEVRIATLGVPKNFPL